MSKNNQCGNRSSSLVSRLMSNQRIQNALRKPRKFTQNVLEKYSRGSSITRDNAKETLNEMSYFFSANKAKYAYYHCKDLAIEAHEDLIGCKLRVLTSTIGTVLN